MNISFHAGSVIITAMIILSMASISGLAALLFTQTAIASSAGQDETTTTTDTTTTPTGPNNATRQRVAVGGGNITYQSTNSPHKQWRSNQVKVLHFLSLRILLKSTMSCLI